MAPQSHRTKVGFSILIPARNEADGVGRTVNDIVEQFRGTSDYEILVINDHSSDNTRTVIQRLADRFDHVRHIENHKPPGFGNAVRTGLRRYRGSAAGIVMADASESPEDILTYYEKIKRGCPCVFGSRFIPGGRTCGYPRLKLAANRAGNRFISALFRMTYNDITNGFKAYRRHVIDDVRPLRAEGFDLCVELPLKAILKGYPVEVVPVSWERRTAGRSKFKVGRTCVRYMLRTLSLLGM